MTHLHDLLRTRRRGILPFLLLVAMLLGPGCRKKKGDPDSPGNPILAFRDVGGGGGAAQPSSGRPTVSTTDPHCMRPEVVKETTPDDPEHPLAEVYRAALMPESPAAFARFESQFLSSKDRSFLRDQHWPRIRKHVRSYVQDPSDFSFQVCKRKVRSDGSVKLFVRSFDPKKSHPPSIVRKEKGVWKLDFFTW